MIKKWRRKRLLARPFPEAWCEHLDQNVRHFRLLSNEQREKLRQSVVVMVAEKEWVGCRGLEMTDEIKVTIAGQAGLMLLGHEAPYYFDGVLSVLVYPEAFVTDLYQETFGEAWPRGPVILSWRHVKEGGRDPADGLNLVLHEFAHQLDGLDGDMSGIPPLGSRRRLERWREVAEREYVRLVNRADRGEITLLDHYGASNRAEFFAVATECFFERPLAMQRQHPELYAIFSDFYRLDPAQWFAGRDDSGVGRGGDPPEWYVQKAAREEALEVEMEGFNPATDTADVCFSRGVLNLQNEDWEQAHAEFDRAIALGPDDAETRHHRALAAYHLERFPDAIGDCDRAIELDPQDIEAYRIRGLAHDALEQDALAIEDWNRVLTALPDDAEAWYQRGLAYQALGELAKAIQDLTQAIRNAPDWADPYWARSEAHEALGRADRARADREEAVRRDPDLEEEPAD